ncbi:ABC transporter permease [Fusibacter bizertensis]
MPVFKVSMKIIQKNLPLMLIYIVIFVMVSMIVKSMNSNEGSVSTFSDTKVPIAIIAEENTPITNGLATALSDVSTLVSLKDDQEAIQDALYFRAVYMVIRIPEGFSASLMSSSPIALESTTIPGSTESVQVNMQINQFMKLSQLYLTGSSSLNEETLTSRVLKQLKNTTKVTMVAPDPKALEGGLMPFFFNYLAYSYMFIMILGVSTVMMVFNRKEIKWRNACSPITGLSKSLQFLLANAVFAFGTWVILILLCLVFDAKNIFKVNTLYFMLNSIVFALSVLGLGYLIGNLVKGREAVSAVANIITLSSCFISGIFVPQAFLGESVLRVASFFPTYWYVKANLQIANLTQFDFSSISGILGILLIELGFGAAFLAVSLAVGKRASQRA